jgi:Transposase domain (DUF772)
MRSPTFYCLDDGRPGIDPEVAVRLMLAGLLSGIAHDRKLMREAHVIRWFIGYGVHERLPDHSSLTRAISAAFASAGAPIGYGVKELGGRCYIEEDVRAAHGVRPSCGPPMAT